ncbi:MAG: polymerase sigma factor RpoE [Myxococcales bacterium]|nr:polymerase sigma factor RpoE [Myxococcales bacterium]
MPLPALSMIAPAALAHARRGDVGVTRTAESPALAELFRRYARYVATIGLRLLGRDDELDDLVQDVFIEAHRGLHQLRDLDAAKGWLARITVRRAVRRLRRQKLRAFFSLEALGADAPAVADEGASPEERAYVAVTYRRLEALPVPQRIAWLLRHVEGETLDSIAALCGCSKATVQRRLRAARAALGQDARDAGDIS